MKLSDIARKWADMESIMDSADILGLYLDVRPSDPIEKVAEAYSSAVLSNLESILPKLGYTELTFLSSLAKGMGGHITKDRLYPAVISLFLLDYKDDGDGMCILEIPSDLASAVVPLADKVLIDPDYLDDADFAQFILGIINTYGMIRKQELLSILASKISLSREEDEHPHEDEEEEDADVAAERMFVSGIAHSAALNLAIDDSIPAPDGDFWLVSPYMDNPSQVLEERLKHPEFQDYKDFSSVELFVAGDTMLPIFPNAENKAYIGFLSKDMKMDTVEIDDSLSHFWLQRQNVEFSPEDVIQTLAKAIHDTGTLSKMMEQVMAYNNACPRWGLKGHSTMERMKPSRGTRPADDKSDGIPSFYKGLMTALDAFNDAPYGFQLGLTTPDTSKS